MSIDNEAILLVYFHGNTFIWSAEWAAISDKGWVFSRMRIELCSVLFLKKYQLLNTDNKCIRKERSFAYTRFSVACEGIVRGLPTISLPSRISRFSLFVADSQLRKVTTSCRYRMHMSKRMHVHLPSCVIEIPPAKHSHSRLATPTKPILFTHSCIVGSWRCV